MARNFEIKFHISTIKVIRGDKNLSYTCLTLDDLMDDVNDAQLFTDIGIFCRETFGEPMVGDHIVWSLSPGARWIFADPKHAALFKLRFDGTIY